MAYNILIVDDEVDICEFLSYNLKNAGYTIETANNGQQCLKKLNFFSQDLIILDIMMPKMDGIQTCEAIKKDPKFQDVIILFLSARNEAFSQISCYEAGADDFLTKPIHIKLLMKKISSLFRLSSNLNSNTNVINGISIDLAKFIVEVDGVAHQMTKTEFELFSLLFTKPDFVFKRSYLISKIWGEGYYVSDRNLDVQIRKIRKVVGADKIGTVKGVGYKFFSS